MATNLNYNGKRFTVKVAFAAMLPFGSREIFFNWLQRSMPFFGQEGPVKAQSFHSH
jgi:hypothetical protein